MEDTAPTSVRVMLLWLHTSRARLNWQACISSCMPFSCSPCSKKKSAAACRSYRLQCWHENNTDRDVQHEVLHSLALLKDHNVTFSLSSIHCQAPVWLEQQGKESILCRLHKMAEH